MKAISEFAKRRKMARYKDREMLAKAKQDAFVAELVLEQYHPIIHRKRSIEYHQEQIAKLTKYQEYSENGIISE